VTTTEVEQARLRGWLTEVAADAERYGDLVDPSRTGNTLSRKIDTIGRLAREAIIYVGA
jgi:hypothetical protein